MEKETNDNPRSPQQERIPPYSQLMPSTATERINETLTVALPPVKVEQLLGAQFHDQPSLISNPRATPFNVDITQSLSDTIMETCTAPEPLPLLSHAFDATLAKGTKRNYSSMDNQVGAQQSEFHKKHDPTKEPLPKMATNHASFHSAERIALSIPDQIISTIEQSGHTDEDFDYLKGEADRAKQIYKAGEIKIGLKGSTGTGKSSLVNSLLGYDGIAPYGNDGDACTAVVQEFHKPRPTQQLPFEAEILFLQPQVREAALKEWITDYWDSSQLGADEEEDEEESEDVLSKGFDEQLQSGEGSATAAGAIFSLFSDHDECTDLEATKQFLSTATVRGDPFLIGQMKVWMEALLKSLGVESSKLVIRKPTPELLQDAVAPFLAHTNSEHPSPWLVVKLIKCYFDCPILSQDIILADLPGTSDTNKIRLQSTKEYLKEVGHTGVVTRVDRAQSDPDVSRSLFEAYRRKRGSNVFMVATYSDSINPSTPGVMDKYINMPGANAADVKELCELKEELETNKLDLQSVEAQQKQARSSRNYDIMDELENRHNDLKALRVTKLNQSAAACIRIRSNKVKKSVVDRHYHMTKQEILPVFCVSNSEYMIHVNGYDEEHLPKMTVDATEIPKVRAYIYALPDTRKILAFNHHIKYLLPSLTNNLATTCSQSKLKRKEGLEKVFITAQEPIPKMIKEVFEELVDANILAKIGRIKMPKTKNAYINAAKLKLKAYSQWTSSTQKVFCRHKGNWKTNKVGAHDWNAEILAPLVKDIKEDLNRWDDIGDVLGRNLSEKVSAIMHALIANLEATAGPSRDVLEPVFSELRLQIDIVDGLCRTEAEEVEKGLNHIKQCIVSSEDTKTCYFVQALEKTYEECAAMTGPGVRQKRLERLAAKIAQKSVANPFNKIHDKAKSAIQELIKQHAKAFTQIILDKFEMLHNMFMRLFKTDQNDSPEARALRDELRNILPAFQAQIIECGRLLEESREYAKRN